MIHPSDIREIKVITNPDEVNELLRDKNDCWELLEVQNQGDYFTYLLGRTFSTPFAREGTD